MCDITDLTWRDLIDAARIPAAVKFFVLRFPRPFFRVGRRETKKLTNSTNNIICRQNFIQYSILTLDGFDCGNKF